MRTTALDEFSSVKPNFGLLLARKYTTFLPEEQGLDIDEVPSEGSPSDDSLIIAQKGRGSRKNQASCLRIARLERALAVRKDLTQEERRSLRHRKNTANYRERQKAAFEQKYFMNFELDFVLNAVSVLYVPPCKRESGLGPKKAFSAFVRLPALKEKGLNYALTFTFL